MTCDHGRCWRLATVVIPEYGAYCSGHVFAELSTWPQHRFEEIETENRRRWTLPSLRRAA